MQQSLVWEIVLAKQEMPTVDYPLHKIPLLGQYEAAESYHCPVAVFLTVPLVSFPSPWIVQIWSFL
jgi:hypothetical protein